MKHRYGIISSTTWLELIILLFAFQRALISFSGLFSYLDEGFVILVTAFWIVSVIKRGAILKKDFYLVEMMLLLLIEGLFSNSLSRVLNNSFAIVIDIISIFKVFLSYLWIKDKNCDGNKIIQDLAKIGRVIVYIIVVSWILSQFVNTGMMYRQVRHGIRSFMFVFNNSGNYSKFFYFLLPLLTADLKFGINRYKKITIVLACVMWMSSMRSRAFSFVAMYAMLAFLYFRNNDRTKPGRFRWDYLIVIGIVALAFSFDQLIFYFTNDTQARSLLLRNSIYVMKEYFPIGAGFGTYGSDVAAEYYSSLYNMLGFSSIYGMGKTNTIYLNDNYWPMIFGQFGIIGTVLIIGILLNIHKDIYEKIRKDRYFFFSGMCAMLLLAISSIASKSYSEFSSICVFLLLGVMGHGAKKETLQ